MSEIGKPYSRNESMRNRHLVVKERAIQAEESKSLREKCTQERKEVLAAGGLHVIGTGHHESVRIDNQLRGRAGRQGDPGSSQVMVSLDDEIWKKFGKPRIAEIRTKLRREGHPKNEPIETAKVRRVLRSLQKKVDVENQAIRRDVLKYDLVVHAQRETIYGWRRTLVTGEGYDPVDLIRGIVDDLLAQTNDSEAIAEALRAHFNAPFDLPDEDAGDLESTAMQQALAILERREKRVGPEALHELGRQILLQTIDDLWTEHLSNLERVEEGIGLRGYAEVDPVIEWRKEATQMWQQLLRFIRSRAVTLWFLVEVQSGRDDQ